MQRLSPQRQIAPALLPATWRTALGALRRNKMRSGLSALGVIIAVAAVIAMTEIGQGSKATLQKGIASMGANTLMIFCRDHRHWRREAGDRHCADAHAPGRQRDRAPVPCR